MNCNIQYIFSIIQLWVDIFMFVLLIDLCDTPVDEAIINFSLDHNKYI